MLLKLLTFTRTLSGLGLTLATAGELHGIHSENELSAISEMENMIRSNMAIEGVPLSAESIRHLEMECGALVTRKALTVRVDLTLHIQM